MASLLKNFFKKDIYIIIVVQLLCTLAVIAFLQWGYKPESKDVKTDSSTTASINALSARLGQVQVDLNQIKSKLGAGQPPIQNQKKQ